MSERVDGENRPRPAQFMPHHFAQRFLLKRVRHQHRRQDDPEPGQAHSLADGVIVGQLVGDRLEAADPRQRLPVERDCLAKARPGQAERQPDGRAGQEMIVDPHRGQPRPEAAVRQAAVEAGDHPDARLGQGRGQRAQIIWTDRNVAVGEDNEGMASDLSHVDEVGDLAVAAMRGAVDDQLKIKLGISPHQRFDDRNRAVVGVLHAEDKLYIPRIILIEIGFDVLR
jgi:hypothetical protein